MSDSSNNNNKAQSLMAQLGQYLAEQMSYVGVNIDLVADKVKEKLGIAEGAGSGEGDPSLTVKPNVEIGSVVTGTEQTMKHSEWLKKILTAIVSPSISIKDGATNAVITGATYVMGEALVKDSLTITATASAGSSNVKYIKEGDNGTQQASGVVSVKYPSTAITEGSTTTTSTTYKFIAEGNDGGKTEVSFVIDWVFKYKKSVTVSNGSIVWGEGDFTYKSGAKVSLVAPANGKAYLLLPSVKSAPSASAYGFGVEVTNEGSSTTLHNMSYTIWSVKNDDMTESSQIDFVLA